MREPPANFEPSRAPVRPSVRLSEARAGPWRQTVALGMDFFQGKYSADLGKI